MAIPQIQPYDYFHQWRSKTNEIATLVGDIASINVAAPDRDTLVEAINKVISNMGTLGALNTTAKNTLVAAINEIAAASRQLNHWNRITYHHRSDTDRWYQ
jgi:hypothetical protein